MNFRFCLSQPIEDLDAGGLDSGAEFAPLEQAADLRPGPRRFLARTDYMELRGTDSMDRLFRCFESELQRRYGFEFGFQFAYRQTQIDHRGDEHIAADAADEVSVS